MNLVLTKRQPIHSTSRHSSHFTTLAALLTALSALVITTPVLAHHPMGGKISTNFIEGFLSGIAHPIIGVDHLAFIVAVGLLAASFPKGVWVSIVFVISALLGTGIHLQSINLPIAEIIVAVSIIVFGSMLAIKYRPTLPGMLFLTTSAGLFHGYAYGESIVGATTVPLVAYLLGFTLVQLAISIFSYRVSRITLQKVSEQSNQPLRLAGFTIVGIGIAFLTNQFTL